MIVRKSTMCLAACAILLPAISVQAEPAVWSMPAVSQQQQDPLRYARGLYRDGLYDVAVDQLKQLLGSGLPLQYAEEARWLLAEAYGWSGDREGREAALVALIQSGIGGKWRERAEAALKEKR